MTTLYGIKNCDTIRKARKWLESNGVNCAFHDVRSDGIDSETVAKWVNYAGWEKVLNKRGTTWRQLAEEVKNNVSGENIVDLLTEHPTMIKRPVLETGSIIEIGFSEARYRELFNT